MNRNEILSNAIALANERLASGDEPPWLYYRLWQLREAAQCLLEGRITPLGPEDSPALGKHQENDPPQAGEVVQLSSARCREQG